MQSETNRSKSATATATGTAVVATGAFLNQLEPSKLVDAFMHHPPENFLPVKLLKGTPAFVAHFDLLTTLDDDQMWIADKLRSLPLVSKLLKQKTLFVGTTVSEYCWLKDDVDDRDFADSVITQLELHKAQLAIVKDFPEPSSLINEKSATKSAETMQHLTANGFTKVSGMALAYVTINFQSTDEYLKRLSRVRRKEFKRKLKAKEQLVIEELRTGEKLFDDPLVLFELYQLYLNVYNQSKYHFDKLSATFFKEVLQDSSNNGIMFLYRKNGELIGFNLCFVFGNTLIDKYVGFAYPQAHQSNLYFVSWFQNLDYALRHQLQYYIAGWTDPEVKKALGAEFTWTNHAVYIRNPLLRFVLKKLQHLFESDKQWAERNEEADSK